MVRPFQVNLRGPFWSDYSEQSAHEPVTDGLMLSLIQDAPQSVNRSSVKQLIPEFSTTVGPTEAGIQMVKDYDTFLSTSAIPTWLAGCDEDPVSASSVLWWRQFLRLTWKIDTGILPREEETRYAAARRIATSGRHDPRSIYFWRAKRAIYQLFARIPLPCELICKHGPGGTADAGSNLPVKLRTFTLFKTMRPWFHSYDLVDPERVDEGTVIEYQKRGITKMVAVSKDCRGPRIISEEPCSLMYIQQGIKAYLQPRLEKMTEMQFSDQLAHRALLYDAHNSSLDLSDASDYVSRRLVWNLFPSPWREYLFAARSQFINTGDTLFPIRAFAPMGSALCFPVEAIVHWAAIKAAQEDVKASLRRPFSVYGDDLIVDSIIAGSVMTALRALGLQPNVRKCFINKTFRESCGLDLYGKVDVTPTYLRSPVAEVDHELNACKFAQNQVNLARNGFTHAAAYLRMLIERYHRGFPTHDGFADRTYIWLWGPERANFRFCPELQRIKIRARALVPMTRTGHLCDHSAALGVLSGVYRSSFTELNERLLVVQWVWYYL